MAEHRWMLACLLLTAILLSASRNLVSAQLEECAEGEVLLVEDNEHRCVADCPCGYSVNEDQICSSMEEHDAFFNRQSQVTVVPVNAEPGSYIATMWLSVRNRSFHGDLSLSFRFQTLVAYYIDRYRVYFPDVPIKFEIFGTTVYLNKQTFVVLSEATLSQCDGEGGDYFQIPVRVSFAGDVNFPGRIEHYLTLKLGIGTASQTTLFNDLTIEVENVCPEDQFYLASTGQCVAECPCGTKTITYYCDERIPYFEMDPVFWVIDADPATTASSVVATFNLYFNVTPGTGIADMRNPALSLDVFPFGVTHNAHGEVDSDYFYFLNPHVYLPAFNLKLDGGNPDNPVFVNGSSLADLFPAMNPGVEMCAGGNSTFLRVGVELHLASPYFYHLGQHELNLYAVLYDDDFMFLYYTEATLLINVNTDEECGLAEHYRFDTGGCVEECPCGFVGFDDHNPHYCEPATEGSFFWYYYIYFFFFFDSPARFSETAYKVALPWNDPFPRFSFQSKVNVYFRSPFNFYDDELVARIEVLYAGSNYTNGSGYGIDIPDVVLTGPVVADDGDGRIVNTTGKVINLLLQNSSRYGMQYCSNDLWDETFGYIPVTVTIVSPQQYSYIANHSFVLHMTFEEPYDFFYFGDTADLVVIVEEGDIGQTPRPVTVDPLVEGIDYLPFINLSNYDHHELQPTRDGSSDPISISIGLPFGNSLQTEAYVGVNGIISFGREWPFSNPSRFPTSWYTTREGYVVAPFWADHDLRSSGTVRYATFSTPEGGGRHELLTDISTFVREWNEEAEQSNFEGVWMLVAHWDDVHPYPHGSSEPYYQRNYEDFIEKQNSYQAVVITNGADTYTLFSYHCDQMEWTGSGQHGVVGYNARGDYYANHPAAGFDFVGAAVACANDFYGVPWNNVLFKISLTPMFRMNARRECISRVRADQERIPDPIAVSGLLEPCPCSLDQARRDWGRFTWLWNEDLCFVQNFPINMEVPEGNASFTQECCYAQEGTESAGSLIVAGQYAGSMLSYHPATDYDKFVEYDQLMRDYCCGVADMCSRYFSQRPVDDCTGYEPPALTWGIGDPHITTLDGRSYTFNGWGEYVLLEYTPRNGASPEFVVQGRTTPVNSSNPNSATQFSAFAFGMPGQITYQVGQDEDGIYVYRTGEETVEDITSLLSNVSDTYAEDGQRATLTRQSEDSVLAVFGNGVGVMVNVTAGWIPNFVLSLPTPFRGQTRGLLGNYNGNKTDEFVPRDGPGDAALSDTISDEEIHKQFGQTWAISAEESLFAYSLEGRFYPDYQFPDHIPVFADQLVVTTEHRLACGDDTHCLYDYSQTGSVEIGLATMELDKTNTQDQMLLANFPPNMTGDGLFRVTVGQLSQYSFTVADDDNAKDAILVGVIGGPPTSAALIDRGQGVYVFQWSLQEPTNVSLSFFATDSANATTTLSPRVEVCGCINGGECTLEGLLVTDASTVVMNCNCTSAFAGPFCKEDRDGCVDVGCYEGVECLDVPAPGVGAECGPCPAGFTGDGTKCLDLNECTFNPSVCNHLCSNTEGSYNCLCWPGYKMNEEGICEDINECSEVNDCQQKCINSLGSYSCSCSDGFELANDNRSCQALTQCSEDSCSHVCAVVDGVETCSCHAGYQLESGSSGNCIDVDECVSHHPCTQECTNLPGSFECWCSQGYTLGNDGVTCSDVDECAEGALYDIDLCNDNTTCVNNVGGYDCVCSPGYSLSDGNCQREVDLPPPVIQITPPNAVNNRMRVVVDGLTLSQFTPDRRQEFKVITAQLVTEYCSTSDCVTASRRKRRQTVIVEAQDVALQNIGEDGEGRVSFLVYVELPGGILAQEVLEGALQGNEQQFVDGVVGLTTIIFDVVVLPSTSLTSAPAETSTLSGFSPSSFLASQEVSATSSSSKKAAVGMTTVSFDVVVLPSTSPTSAPAETATLSGSSSSSFLASQEVSMTSSLSEKATSNSAQPVYPTTSFRQSVTTKDSSSSSEFLKSPAVTTYSPSSTQIELDIQSSTVTPTDTSSYSTLAFALVGVTALIMATAIVIATCITIALVFWRRSHKKTGLLLDETASMTSVSPMYTPSSEKKEPFPDKPSTSEKEI